MTSPTTRQIRRAYVDGPFGQIHLRTCGEGEPALLLHQAPLSSVMFEPALPYLARAGLRAIAIDTPGYGLSDGPAERPSLPTYAEAPLAVLDALGLRRAHVVGQHSGAAIAACFAARHPERVSRLVLDGVPILSRGERARLAGMDFSAPAPRRDGGHLIEAWRRRIEMNPETCDLAWMHRFTVETLLAGERCDWAIGAILCYDMEVDLRAISAQTLLHSATGDSLHRATMRAAAVRPDMALTTFEGSQDAAVENPSAWSETIARFLANG